MHIYDGDITSATEIERLTGILLAPIVVSSTGPSIFIHFLADESGRADGFKIQYNASKN